jgi:hypothetical protein
MSEELVTQSDLKLIRDQVDQLQIHAAEAQKPWYRQSSNVVSLAAVVFSIVSFLISQQQSNAQELRAKHEELRRLLIELISFQESLSANIAAITDPIQREEAGGALNSKKLIYLQSAESMADELSSHVSSAEYSTLGRQEMTQSDFRKAERYFLMAPNAANDLISKAMATRDIGEFYFQMSPLRDIEKGRKYFSDAADITKTATDDYSLYCTGYTYDMWGSFEKLSGFQIDGDQKLALAREYYKKISSQDSLGAWALEALEKRSQTILR